MFGWLADIFASSGFAPGQAWAVEKQAVWRLWRAAFSDWWVGRWVRAPGAFVSAWLGRHGSISTGRSGARIVGVIGALGYYGAGAVVALSSVPAPGLFGWFSALRIRLAAAFWTPRFRRNCVLRPVKCAIVLALAGGVYWAATSVVFHYAYRVDIWSEPLWREIEIVWRADGNLRWSALWNLVAITLAWYGLSVR